MHQLGSRVVLFALMMLAARMPLLSARAAPAPKEKATIHYEKTFTLEAGSLQEIEFTAPANQQKVSVTTSPTTAGVSAYLLKSSDLKAVKADLDKEKEPPARLLLASRVSKGPPETYSFEATVPAKTPYVLLLKNSKKTEVKVKLVGR